MDDSDKAASEAADRDALVSAVITLTDMLRDQGARIGQLERELQDAKKQQTVTFTGYPIVVPRSVCPGFEGARSNAEIETMVHQGVEQGMKQIRRAVPDMIRRHQADPRLRRSAPKDPVRYHGEILIGRRADDQGNPLIETHGPFVGSLQRVAEMIEVYQAQVTPRRSDP